VLDSVGVDEPGRLWSQGRLWAALREGWPPPSFAEVAIRVWCNRRKVYLVQCSAFRFMLELVVLPYAPRL
jgi:hypothetical protein